MTTPGTLVISQLSTEYVIVPVNSVVDGMTYNPIGDVVEFAFTVGYGVKPSVWIAGQWDPNPVQGIWYNAKVLIGPGSLTVLTPGTYTVWVKIVDNPSVPVRQAGTVTIQ